MNKRKLTMLAIMGVFAVGASTFASSFEGVDGGGSDRLSPGAPAPEASPGGSGSEVHLLGLSMRVDAAGPASTGANVNRYGDTFEMMQRNMDMMEAYYDKHAKRVGEPFERNRNADRDPAARPGKEAPAGEKDAASDKVETEKPVTGSYSVSRRAAMLDDLPIAVRMPEPGHVAGVPLSEGLRGSGDGGVDNTALKFWESENEGSLILDQLEKIDPVSLDDLEAWDAKSSHFEKGPHLDGSEAPGPDHPALDERPGVLPDQKADQMDRPGPGSNPEAGTDLVDDKDPGFHYDAPVIVWDGSPLPIREKPEPSPNLPIFNPIGPPGVDPALPAPNLPVPLILNPPVTTPEPLPLPVNGVLPIP